MNIKKILQVILSVALACILFFLIKYVYIHDLWLWLLIYVFIACFFFLSFVWQSRIKKDPNALIKMPAKNTSKMLSLVIVVIIGFNLFKSCSGESCIGFAPALFLTLCFGSLFVVFNYFIQLTISKKIKKLIK